MLGRISGRMRGRIFGPMSSTRPTTCLSRRSRRCVAGQAEAEPGAVTGAALDRDRAAVLFENAPANGESESGTAGPRAESRIEDARQVVLGDARPGIAHLDFHAAALHVLARGAFRAADREPSAAGHEAQRVERQVEQDLLEAVPVGRNGDAIQAVDDLHFDARLL